MKVSMHYGKGRVELEIPERNVARVVRPWAEDAAAADAFKPFDLALAENFIRLSRGKRVCVLVPDGTRDFPWNAVLEPLCRLLTEAAHVRFLLCTGTHASVTQENVSIRESIDAYAWKASLGSFDTVVHDCREAEYRHAGRTRYGTEVLYNAAAEPADVFVALSDIKFHYFAGYSNPVKNLVPGICAYRTAERNHSLTFDDRSGWGAHPWHPDPARRDQPLAADQVEAMERIVGDRPFWAAVTISSQQKLLWAAFGPAREMAAIAFEKVDAETMHTVEPAPRVIVSPGGHPEDGDLYIAQRALELTKAAFADDGEVLFAAACLNGIGAACTMENFYNRLTRPLDEVLSADPAAYRLFSHKPYRFAQLIRRLRRLWLWSELNEAAVEAAHLHPTRQPQAVIDGWIRERPDVKILVVDQANKLALRTG